MVSAIEFCCPKISNQTEYTRFVVVTKLCCRDKDFYKNSPVHTKQLVAAMCHSLLHLVAQPVCTQGVICHHDMTCFL